MYFIGTEQCLKCETSADVGEGWPRLWAVFTGRATHRRKFYHVAFLLITLVLLFLWILVV